MTIDESANWTHAAALERGDVPQIPETAAADSIGRLLSKHIDVPLTDGFWRLIGSKCIAARVSLRFILDEYEANPARLPERGKVLRQQQVSETDSVTWWEEHTHHLKREYEDSLAILERVRQGRLAEFDPDAREQDRENDRLREVAQDEAAREAAPRGVAS